MDTRRPVIKAPKLMNIWWLSRHFSVMVNVQTAPELLKTLVLLPKHHCMGLYLGHATPGQCGTQNGSDKI
jgi:hypothetical protein